MGDRRREPQQPLISVVMPAHNAAPYIAAAIESVLRQTLHDLELVVIDDGSTDATWQIISYYAQRDPRVTALRNETNLGISPTLNRGIEAARSDLIGRMDADDISVNHRFADQLAYLEAHPDVAVVGTYAYHINDEGTILGLSTTGPASIQEFTELRRSGAHTMVFGGSAVFTKALAAKVGGYDEAFVTAEDLEIFDRMADHGPVVVMTEPLLLYRIYPSSYVMRTFFEGRIVHRYVRDRRRRKMAKRPEITLDEFKRRQRARPRRHRIAVRLDDLSRYLYRMAGVEFASRRNGRAVGFLALAALTQPGYAIPRIWSQRLSPGARRSRMAATREQERARG